MYFFTADEHYGHARIIKYQKRPFKDVMEMDEAIIENNNALVKAEDTVIHAGDFCWFRKYYAQSPNDNVINYINRLNGNHIFLKGSHDKWMPSNRSIQIWEKPFGKNIYLVVCHHAMHTWARSHYNSWHLYGHSHHDLNLSGKRYCISVENTKYFPVSFEEIEAIMEAKGDNPNYTPDKR